MKLSMVLLIVSLIILCTGCGAQPVNVQNKDISLELVNGDQAICYSGMVQGNKLIGKGTYVLLSGDTEWVYEGECANRNFVGDGVADGMPLYLKIDGVRYKGKYNGMLSEGILCGTGTFFADEVGFKCVGNFENGELCAEKPYSVENATVEIEFQGRKYVGQYSGEMTRGKPSGEGNFGSDFEENYFEYKGSWNDDGALLDGYLKTSSFDVDFTDVVRNGVFEGEIKNSTANGNGTFSSTNGEGIDYTYSGEWKNGKFEGIGEIKYDAENYYQRKGHFSDGQFTPDFKDLITTLGTAEPMFTATKQQLEYADKYSNFADDMEFKSRTEYYKFFNEFVDKEMTYKQYIRNPESYADTGKMMYLDNYKVVQVVEKNDLLGFDEPISWMIIQDSRGEHVCWVLLRGDADRILEGIRLNVWGYPISASHYMSTSGVTINCIYLVGSAIDYR